LAGRFITEVKEIIMSESKQERNKLVMQITQKFLDAVMRKEPWHKYAQLRTRKMKAAPNIPAFTGFKVVRTHAPGGGLDSDVCRSVFLELTLGGNDTLRLQTVSAKLLVVKECDWDECPDCKGTGTMGIAHALKCQLCDGTGKLRIDHPRIPTKGTETFEHDLENGVWGVCPTSFEFIDGTQKPIE